MSWDAENIARARKLWDEGLSTAEIGRRLDVSKNSVVSMAHRNHFPSRPSPIKRKGEGAVAERPLLVKESRAALASIVAGREKPKPVSASPSRRCIWTEGGPGAWVFCDELAVRQCFCAAHAERGLTGKKFVSEAA